MRTTLRLLLAFLPVALCACTSADRGALDASALRSAAYPLLSGTAEPEGGVLSSRLKAGGYSTLRRDVLPNDGTLPGENFVTVETKGPRGARGALLRPPTVEMLGGEMRAALPGVAMRVQRLAAGNAGAPLAYALGTARGASCIYAWRWRDRSAETGALLRRRDPVSIRIRLCGNAAPEALLRAALAVRIEEDPAAAPQAMASGGGDALVSASAALGLAAIPGEAGESLERPALAPTLAPALTSAPARPPRIAQRPKPAEPQPRSGGDMPNIPAPLPSKIAEAEQAAGPPAVQSAQAGGQPKIPAPPSAAPGL